MSVKHIFKEVGIAARQTPRLYFQGAQDIVHFVGRIFGPHQERAPRKRGMTQEPSRQETPLFTPPKAKALGKTAPSSLRLGKRLRMKKAAKK